MVVMSSAGMSTVLDWMSWVRAFFAPFCGYFDKNGSPQGGRITSNAFVALPFRYVTRS